MPRLRNTKRPSTAGQILPFTAIGMLTLLLFVGVGVDYGFVYLVRANLSKSVDAAALAAIRNLRHGRASVTNVARAAFAANYESSAASAHNASAPTVSAELGVDASDNALVTVDASVDVRTFFLGIVPGMRAMRVTAQAETIRPKMILSLVLDTSGSMLANGGAAALPDAVDAFLTYFDDAIDRVAVSNYASAARIDVAMTRPFKSRVSSTLAGLVFDGATASEQGILRGYDQARTVTTLPNEEVVKSLVFFTDGVANTFQLALNCGARNVYPDLRLFDPTTGAPVGGGCTVPATLTSVDPASGVVSTGDQCAMQLEAERRAEAIARQARNAGIYIYAVGLGGSAGVSTCGRATLNVPFLQRVANDPTSGTYDAAQPTGAVAVAENAGDLERVFGEIAQMVLYRLRR